MNVGQIMRTPVVSIHESTSLEEAARAMLDHDLRGIPVVNQQGKICGFLSVSDFVIKDKYFVFGRQHVPQLFGNYIPREGIEELYEQARTNPVSDIMSRDVVYVTEDEPVEKVLELMLYRDLNRIPVVRDDVPVGIIARYDVLKMIADRDLISK